MPAADDAAILDAATRAFATHGYAETTMERIAAEAGVSRVTLHRRGMTKDGLLELLAARATEGYRDAMWPILTGRGTGAARLKQALEALCGSAEEHMTLMLAVRAKADGIFHEDAGDAEAPTLTRSPFTEPLERLLLDGAADGSLRPVDAEETATVLFNVVGWGYIHLRSGHRWPPEKACEAVIAPMLHGLVAFVGPVR